MSSFRLDNSVFERQCWTIVYEDEGFELLSGRGAGKGGREQGRCSSPLALSLTKQLGKAGHVRIRTRQNSKWASLILEAYDTTMFDSFDHFEYLGR